LGRLQQQHRLVQQPDNIERALALIDKHERPFEVEISELQTGLQLIEQILAEMNAINTYSHA
jgi:hypothetical protein